MSTTDSQPTAPLSRLRPDRLSLVSTPSESPVLSPVRQRALRGASSSHGLTTLAEGQRRRPTISIDRIRAGSIFSPTDGIDHEIIEDLEDGSRRSSLAAAEEIRDAKDEELHVRHNQPLVRTGGRLYNARNPIIVGLISISVLWAAVSIGTMQIPDVVYRTCQLPLVPAIASQLPLGLCDLAPLTEETFTKVLDARARYEKIYRYAEKRASLPGKMIKAAKRADADEPASLEKDGDTSAAGLSPKTSFLHSADYRHAVLDLTSFLKQAKGTAQRLVVAEKAAKLSLDSLLFRKKRWAFLKTAGYQKWQVMRIHDDLTEASVAQITLVLASTDVARQKIEVLEQSIYGMEGGTEPEQSPVHDIITHLQEAHALLELVKDGAEKIRDDLLEAQKSRRSLKRGPRTGSHKMTLESMVTIYWD